MVMKVRQAAELRAAPIRLRPHSWLSLSRQKQSEEMSAAALTAAAAAAAAAAGIETEYDKIGRKRRRERGREGGMSGLDR